jgi:hypothetical protein
MNCSEHCNSIINEMIPISDKIKKLNKNHTNKTYSTEDLEKYNVLEGQLENIQYRYYECMMDCERRNCHRDSDEKPPPIDENLRKQLKELKQLEESDDDNFGGNKRQSRRRRRRSFRNKTNQKHSRR